MSKHTPGPWKIDKNIVRSESAKTSIAHILDVAWPYGSRPKSPESNAHLIAAAPLMYEALKGLMENPKIDLGDLVYIVKERECEGWDGPNVVAWSNAVQLARAALQSAKGGDGGK